MIDLRHGKKQLDLDMKTLADQKFDLETQMASYEFKHKSLEELLATLKDGQSNARVQKMIEWQQKLEKVKLNELRHIRLNKRLETDVSSCDPSEGIIQTSADYRRMDFTYALHLESTLEQARPAARDQCD